MNHEYLVAAKYRLHIFLHLMEPEVSLVCSDCSSLFLLHLNIDLCPSGLNEALLVWTEQGQCTWPDSDTHLSETLRGHEESLTFSQQNNS